MSTGPLYLVVVGSQAPPRALPESGSLVIGSSPELAGLVLDAPDVDSAHCAIGRLKEGGFALKDLGSKAGVLVNDKRVQAARLAHGDRLRIGAAVLEVTRGGTPQVPGMRMQRRLGRGAMGEVWLAVQERLERPVALKFLSPALARDAAFVRRFESEARAAAALNHPNVVVVYDVGTVAAEAGGDALHYLSMEYMEGGSVEDLVARKARLAWREVLPILRDAARALDYARARQLVHRDVKPANLMFGPGGLVKLSDLGLAASTHPEAVAADAGGERRIFGTPHFIAPEQARGEPADHRSDLYALGATVWRLLAGRTPFQGATTREILRAAFTQAPPPLAPLAPDCPAQAVRLIERLLAKDPRERPQSAAELLQALDALEHGSTPAARVPTQGATRSRTPLLLGAAALGALALIAWLSLRGRGEPRDGELATPAGAKPVVAARGPELEAPPLAATAAPRAPTTEEARVRELEAQLALRDAPPASTPAARLEALRALARQHAGTVAAANAENECVELERVIARAAQLEASSADAHARAVARLDERCAVDANAAPLEALVRALHELRGPATEIDVAADPLLLPLRDERERVLLDALAARAQAALAEAERARAAGEHARLPDLLGELARLPEPPASGAAAAAPQRAALAAARARAGEWLELSSSDSQRYASELERAERQRLAERLGAEVGGRSLAEQWSAFEFAPARARLSELETSAHAPTRALASARAAELDAARATLDALVAALGAGQWKRRTISDPRPGRAGVREVLAIDTGGLRVTREGGEEPIAWSAFGSKPESLGSLFEGRLTREWTAEERDGMAAIARFCALARVLPRLQAGLRGSGTRPFGPSEADEIVAELDAIGSWQTSPEARARLEEERVALLRIARALIALSEQRPAEAAADLERVLGDPLPGWIALLLSSGQR